MNLRSFLTCGTLLPVHVHRDKALVSIGSHETKTGGKITMARSVKIEVLVSELAELLPVLGSILSGEKKKLDGTENIMIKSLLAAVSAYNEKELTDKEKAELKKQRAKLAKLAGKHDKYQTDYMLLHAATLAELAEEHKESPTELVAAMVKLEADRVKELSRLQIKREEETEETTEKIKELETAKTMAGVNAAKKVFGYTESAHKTTSHKIGEAEFLIVDLLKRSTGHSVLYVNKDRELWVKPVNVDWEAREEEIGKWYPAGKLADVKELKTQTALQRFAYDWQNRYSGTLEENTERVNAVFTAGNGSKIGKNGNCGGTVNVWRIVPEITKGQGRQITLAEFQNQEKYGFVYQTEEEKSK